MTRKEIGQRLKTNKSWYNKSYAGHFFGIYQQGRAIAWAAGRYRWAMPYGVLFQNFEKSPHMDWFWDYELLQQKRREILEEVDKDKNFADQFYENWKKDFDSYLAYYESIAWLDMTTKSDVEIKEILKQLDTLCLKQAGQAYIVDTFLTNDGDWLVDEIKGELGERATDEIIAHLTAPAYSSFVNEAERELLKVAARQQTADEYVEKYFWIKSNYLDYKRLTSAEVVAEADHRAQKENVTEILVQESKRIEENKAKKSKLFESLNISNRLRRIIHVSEVFTHIQDKRKEGVLRTNTIFLETLDLIAQCHQLDPWLLFNATEIEVFDFLSGKKVDQQRWQERRDSGALILFYADKNEIFERKQWPEILDIDNFFAKHEAAEAKGSVAYKGLVRGRARVMSTSAEIATFNEGEILITNQTTPEFVPAMKKAAAVVTDQGGITCHAAIVSRELQKPCVIGTRIATKIFRNGDLIEVDANRGVVKKIK